ncbi:clathrin interactor EPSIN 1 isoform X4 [Gossypium hirsutum]|nr:clathrin interactor EPSIN 1 isoform X4 [Gossypium hirsutum]
MSFEYVEPSGKDMGINVRKKAETIVGLLHNKERIQEARNKAAANRDKYIGLSSTGVTFKSSASSFSGGGYQGGGDRCGGSSGRRESDSYKPRDRYGEQKFDKDTYVKPRRGSTASESQANSTNESRRHGSKDPKNTYVKPRRGSTTSESQANSTKEPRRHGSKDPKNKLSAKLSEDDKYSQSTSAPTNNFEADDDDFDDFDPRGASRSNPATGDSNQVDLFGQSLMDDLFDGPASARMEHSVTSTDSTEVDLFADATFVSAPNKAVIEASPQAQKQVDLFASQPAIVPAVSPTVDLFAATDPVVQPDIMVPKPDPTNASIIDPFATVPLSNFHSSSDIFGSFTHHSNSPWKEPTQTPINDVNLNNNMNTKPSQDIKPPQKKDAIFQVKSGIWADSLSRGIIDLNISAQPCTVKKVSLADVGILGELSDIDKRDKGPPTSLHMGRAMGTGSGFGKTGFTSATAEDDIFSSFKK